MGSGTATAFADTVVTRPRITVVNGGNDRVYFYTVLNNPARVQVPVIGQITRLPGRFAYHLSATIPPRLLVVAGVPIRFTALQISAGRGTWLAVRRLPRASRSSPHSATARGSRAWSGSRTSDPSGAPTPTKVGAQSSPVGARIGPAADAQRAARP